MRVPTRWISASVNCGLSITLPALSVVLGCFKGGRFTLFSFPALVRFKKGRLRRCRVVVVKVAAAEVGVVLLSLPVVVLPVAVLPVEAAVAWGVALAKRSSMSSAASSRERMVVSLVVAVSATAAAGAGVWGGGPWRKTEAGPGRLHQRCHQRLHQRHHQRRHEVNTSAEIGGCAAATVENPGLPRSSKNNSVQWVVGRSSRARSAHFRGRSSIFIDGATTHCAFRAVRCPTVVVS